LPRAGIDANLIGVNNLTLVIDLAGWIGALLLLVAFGLNALGSLSARSRWYLTLNILGSVLLIVNTGWHRAWPSAFVNVVWVIIASVAALSRANATYTANPNNPNQ
jgi:hypothetical protein